MAKIQHNNVVSSNVEGNNGEVISPNATVSQIVETTEIPSALDEKLDAIGDMATERAVTSFILSKEHGNAAVTFAAAKMLLKSVKAAVNGLTVPEEKDAAAFNDSILRRQIELGVTVHRHSAGSRKRFETAMAEYNRQSAFLESKGDKATDSDRATLARYMSETVDTLRPDYIARQIRAFNARIETLEMGSDEWRDAVKSRNALVESSLGSKGYALEANAQDLKAGANALASYVRQNAYDVLASMGNADSPDAALAILDGAVKGKLGSALEVSLMSHFRNANKGKRKGADKGGNELQQELAAEERKAIVAAETLAASRAKMLADGDKVAFIMSYISDMNRNEFDAILARIESEKVTREKIDGASNVPAESAEHESNAKQYATG